MIKKISGLIFLAGLLLPVAAMADTVAWEFNTKGTQANYGDYTFGIVFEATSNIDVDYLGYYDPTNADGVSTMTGSHAVAIYDLTTGNLTPLVSAVITSSSILSDHFLYTAVTPTELIAGDYYVIEGVSGTTDDYTYGVTGLNTNLPITILGGNNQLNTGLNYDSTIDTTDPLVFGADFAGSPVPEPSSLLLLGSGLAGLASMIKRKLTA
jgi:hypothetical protein